MDVLHKKYQFEVFRICCVCFTICICIALPTFLLGCNTDISAFTCINLFQVKATTVGYHYEKERCSFCDSFATSCDNLIWLEGKAKSCQTSCVHYSFYDCYNVNLVEKYNKNDKEHQCQVNVVHRDRSLENAQLYVMNNYPINESMTIFVNKHTQTCETEMKGKMLTIIGILFFTVAAGVWCVYAKIIYHLHSHVKVISPQQELPVMNCPLQSTTQMVHYPMVYQFANTPTMTPPSQSPVNIPSYPVNYKNNELLTTHSKLLHLK